jgi:hypothetical protein
MPGVPLMYLTDLIHLSYVEYSCSCRHHKLVPLLVRVIDSVGVASLSYYGSFVQKMWLFLQNIPFLSEATKPGPKQDER